MKIRQAVNSDKAACLALYDLGAEEAPEAYLGMTPFGLTDAIERGDTTVADDGKIVGMITSIPAGGATWLGMLVVDEDHRGRTLAPELIKAATARAKNKAMSIVAPHALDSFKKAGFSEKGYLVSYG